MGIALPLKTPFIFTLITSAIGGALLGFFRTTGYVMGGLGVFQFPSFISPDGFDTGFYAAVVVSILAFALAFVLTWVFGNVNKKEQESPVTGGNSGKK